MSRTPSIDGYPVIRELGRGGMGVVYEVEDPKLDRPLALKLMLQSAADADAILRFAQESEVLARVKHPNVVRIHGVGRSEQGPYIVTERVEGDPLDRVLGWGPLTPRRAAGVVRDLCGAVGALHALGVVHRDLKPKNIIMRPGGSPVLIDFGLARDEQAERLTQTGTVMGTLHYMSPEQARGDTRAVGPASDVYGLGAVLFALLAGSAPFNGVPRAGLFAAIASLEPSWPTDVDLRIPPALEAICRRAMSKDATARPNAEGLRAALERFLSAEPSHAAPRWPLAALAGVAAALLLLAVLYATLTPGRTSPAPPPPRPRADPGPVPDPGGDPAPTLPTRNRVKRLQKELARTPPPLHAFREARELLEGSGAARLARLRQSYIRGRLRSDPVVVNAEVRVWGRVRWFDDERIVAASRYGQGLWSWESCSRGTPARAMAKLVSPRFDGATPLVCGSRIFVSGNDGARSEVWGFEWEGGAPLILPVETVACSLAAYEDGRGKKLLAVGTGGKSETEKGTILIFDLERPGTAPRVLRGVHHAGVQHDSLGPKARSSTPQVLALTFSHDGRWLISGGYDGQVVVWDLVAGEMHKAVTPNTGIDPRWPGTSQGGAVQDIALHPTQARVVVCAGPIQAVFSLSIPELKFETLVKHDRGQSYQARFSPDGRYLYSVSGEVINADAEKKRDESRTGELVVWDVRDHAVVDSRSFADQALLSVDLSPNGRRLATYSRRRGFEGVLEVWDIDVPPRD